MSALLLAPLLALAACAGETGIAVRQREGGETTIRIGCVVSGEQLADVVREAVRAGAPVPEGPERRVWVSNEGGRVVVTVCADGSTP